MSKSYTKKYNNPISALPGGEIVALIFNMSVLSNHGANIVKNLSSEHQTCLFFYRARTYRLCRRPNIATMDTGAKRSLGTIKFRNKLSINMLQPQGVPGVTIREETWSGVWDKATMNYSETSEGNTKNTASKPI